MYFTWKIRVTKHTLNIFSKCLFPLLGLNVFVILYFPFRCVSYMYDFLCADVCCLDTGASTVSGFFAAACSLPFDYVKTQIQKMQPDAEGRYPYTGSLDCAMKTLKSGGPFKFYTGFPVYCVRIAPHVMVYSLSLPPSLSHTRTRTHPQTLMVEIDS